MSILSKSQYSKLCSSLQQMNETISQQSLNIENKASLTLCRMDCIKEALDHEAETSLHQGADRLLQIREKMKGIREGVTKMEEKYRNNVAAVKEELGKQLEGIEVSTQRAKQSRIAQKVLLQHKIEAELQAIKEDSTLAHEAQMTRIQQAQKQLQEELNNCSEEISKNRTQLQTEQTTLLTKIGEIGKDLQNKLKEVHQLRKNKKANFLELLEAIIGKIKDMEVVEI